MLLCLWASPGNNTGMGCHFLLQGIFLTQELNPGLLHYRQILYHLSHQGTWEGSVWGGAIKGQDVATCGDGSVVLTMSASASWLWHGFARCYDWGETEEECVEDTTTASNFFWDNLQLSQKSLIQIIKWEGLPGGPVAKTLYAQFGGQGSVPALGARSHSLQPRVQMPQVKCHVLHATTKTQYSQIYKYFLNKIQIKKKNSKSVWL